ncbi:MAG: T9SS type A sorting domain-containing protein [Ignavibacteria bacterium]|nr:T9SS type A sorting domain-containing protein [Ignavibacteria bacterium]
MKTIMLLVITGTALLSTAVAQDKSARKSERHAAFKELRSNLHVWFERDVYPTAKVLHDQYDASLSGQDLQALQALRTEAKRLKEQITADLKSMRSTLKRGDRDELRDKIDELRDRYHDAVKQLLDRLKPIAKRSRTKLREIFDANEDKIESWRDQARQTVGDWRDEHDDLTFKGMFGHGNGQLPLIGADGRRAAIRFILWDGTMPPAPQSKVVHPSRMPLTVSPAPTGNTATVHAANLPDGQHALQVFDMNGTMVRSMQVTAVAGQVNHSIDLSGLAAGTYMVSINTPAGRSTTNVVVNK